MRHSHIALFVFCLVLSACSTTPTVQPTVAPQRQPAAAPAPQPVPPRSVAPSAPAAKPAQAESEAQKFERLVQSVRNKSVYFDFDDYAIKPQFQDLVKQHAGVMKDVSKSTVTLEGNCDERGSREYNLALGQRRAEAVKRMLHMLGTADERMEAISYGKEKPRAACHEEKCWAENRRVDFQYKLK